MYFATAPPVRQKHFNKLLSFYAESIQETLIKYNFQGQIPNEEYFKEELERLKLAGYLFECVYLFVIMSDRSDVFDLEQVLKSEGTEGLDVEEFKNQNIMELVKDDVLRLAEILQS